MCVLEHFTILDSENGQSPNIKVNNRCPCRLVMNVMCAAIWWPSVVSTSALRSNMEENSLKTSTIYWSCLTADVAFRKNAIFAACSDYTSHLRSLVINLFHSGLGKWFVNLRGGYRSVPSNLTVNNVMWKLHHLARGHPEIIFARRAVFDGGSISSLPYCCFKNIFIFISADWWKMFPQNKLRRRVATVNVSLSRERLKSSEEMITPRLNCDEKV